MVLLVADHSIEAAADDESVAVVSVTCPWCPTIRKVRIARAVLDQAVETGDLPESIELSDDDREALISGTCPACWDAMLDVDGEEEE